MSVVCAEGPPKPFWAPVRAQEGEIVDLTGTQSHLTLPVTETITVTITVTVTVTLTVKHEVFF